jgi:hypothetical protein
MNFLRFKLSVLVLALLFLVNGLTTAKVTQAEPGAVFGLPDMDAVKYLGDGFNTVQKDYVYGNLALEFPNGALVYDDGVSSVSDYCFISSKKELEEKFASSFSGNIGVSFPSVTAKTDVTKLIEKSTSFSAEKITIVAYWKQIDKKVYANGLPKLNDTALSVLQSDPKRFMQLYGDRYVSGVTLGKMFYIIYQADTSNVAETNKSSVRTALELSFKKIFGGSLTESQEKFMSEKLSNVSISSKTVAYGISGFTGPYSADDFKNIQYQISQAQSSVIEKTLKDYSYTSNYGGHSFFYSADYYKMANEWEQHLSLLKYITSSSRISSTLKRDCTTAYNNAAAQLELVYSLENNARYPNSDISTFNVLYNRYVTEMEIRQSWYTYDLNVDVVQNQSIDLDLSILGDAETIKIEKVGIDPNTYDSLTVKIFNKLRYTINMYYMDGGNLSLFKTVECGYFSNVNLFEGLKTRDKIHLSFSYQFDDIHGTLKKGLMIIRSSYLEKMTDIVWLYLNDHGLLTAG